MKCLDCKLAKRTFLYGIITLIIVVFSYSFLDVKVANFIHTSDFFGTAISTLAALTSQIFSPKIWAIITAIVTLICIYKHITKKPSEKLYIMSLTLIMTILITTIVKVILARYRPEMLLFDNKYGFHFLSFKKAYNSMPSGHTALTFAGLLAIANFFDKKFITIIAVAVCCFVAVSRIIILDHFISDVIVSCIHRYFYLLMVKSIC